MTFFQCTVQAWLAEFEQACLHSERVVHCHALVSEGKEAPPQCPDEVDRLRIIDDAQCEDELISDELIRGLEVHYIVYLYLLYSIDISIRSFSSGKRMIQTRLRTELGNTPVC